MDEARPVLVVVAGRPGSGKTTLAHALARAVRCPAICRDEIKEGLVNSLAAVEGAGTADEVQRGANRAFFGAVEVLLREGVTVVAEAAFQQKLWGPGVGPLLAIAAVRVVICEVDPEVARVRHVERGLADPGRERFHGDAAVQAAREGRVLPVGPYEPPRLGVPTLVVDTTNGYGPGLEEVVGFVRGAWAGGVGAGR